jgi:uncharacterized membrane protein
MMMEVAGVTLVTTRIATLVDAVLAVLVLMTIVAPPLGSDD